MKESCEHAAECLKKLRLILDGEVSEDEQQEFLKKIESCLPCFRFYNLELAIKDSLVKAVPSKKVPQQLIDDIKSKINEAV
ncbi:MAG: hypothetical protein LAT68_00265 [Cyclobacteriaceae bacterium]|nr:hypothetical protein [Cyclobacteriaceae bacterium]MCH8514735.1 hypothetical protein [Cyclobacteriaceae bacterium]